MASIASGMPWPRILSDPKPAISPTIRLPITGTITVPMPSAASVISTGSAESLPNQNRFVANSIIFSSTHAPQAPPVPTTNAIAASRSMRPSALWSARRCCSSPRVGVKLISLFRYARAPIMSYYDISQQRILC